MKTLRKSLGYLHPAFRVSVKRGDRVRGYRHFDLVSIEVQTDTRCVLVRTRDAWGYDAAEARANADPARVGGDLLWTYFVPGSVPELVGVAIPGSGFSVSPDRDASTWVAQHVNAALSETEKGGAL